jgi:hypothetical protein
MFFIFKSKSIFQFSPLYSGGKIQLILSLLFHDFNLIFLIVSQLITHEVFILNVLWIYYIFLDDVIYMFE